MRLKKIKLVTNLMLFIVGGCACDEAIAQFKMKFEAIMNMKRDPNTKFEQLAQSIKDLQDFEEENFSHVLTEERINFRRALDEMLAEAQSKKLESSRK